MSEPTDASETSRGSTPRQSPSTPAGSAALTQLRGPEVPAVARRFWVVTGAIALVVFAVVIAVSFASAANDNARIDRLKTHGVAVTATVSSCIGNLGGSGSNAANYTCRGTYRVHGVGYDETITGLTSFVATGRTVSAIADPSHPNSLTLASVVAQSRASNSRYVAPTILAVLLLVLALGFLQVLRRPARSRAAPSVLA